jgi:flagellar biogenesis protein FliO
MNPALPTTSRGLIPRRLWIAIGLLTLFASASVSLAQATQPAVPVSQVPQLARDPDEIHRAATTLPTEGSAAVAPRSPLMETGRVVLALGAVIGVILGLKFGAAKIFGIRAMGPGTNKGVRVLSRTMMGPKQQLVLLQVGRRLILVADSAGTVSQVCEISDPDEVAELAAQGTGSAAAAARASFNRELERRETQYDDEEDAAAPPLEPAEPAPDSRELAGLTDRIRRLSNQFSPG